MKVVERVVAVPVEHARAPRHGEWPALLRELAEQLDVGRIYARDLPELATALDTVYAALSRRSYGRDTFLCHSRVAVAQSYLPP